MTEKHFVYKFFQLRFPAAPSKAPSVKLSLFENLVGGLTQSLPRPAERRFRLGSLSHFMLLVSFYIH